MLGILGTTALLLDSGPDDRWGSPRERAVLATLIAHAGHAVTVETLCDWVWPDEAPEDPAQVYDTCVASLRHVLDRLPSPPALRPGAGGYRLELDETHLDLHQCRHLLAEARKHVDHAPDHAIDLAEGAIWLWRGEPLADLTSEPARAWREDVLRTDWLAAHTLRIAALVAAGRFDDALTALDDVQEDFPDDVGLAEQRLDALYGSHRIADGITYFFTTWHRLRDNGHDQAAQHLGQHHTALATGLPEPVTPRATAVPRQLPYDVRDFVGRREQLAALDAACAGPTGVTVLEGPSGVGKTTLAVHWAHRRRARYPDGHLYADLRGVTDHAAVVDDFLVALGQPPDPSLTRRQRELLLSELLCGRHTLVLLDGADDTEHVRDLVALLSSCQVIITSRQRMTKQRTARRIPVGPMTTDEGTRLLSLHTRGDVPDAARLVELCGGIPLLVTVLADDLSGRSATQRSAFAARLERRRLLVPVGGHGCLTSSYRRLTVPERRLFRLLALHPGPDISAEAASAIDGRPLFATLRSLETLVRANLVRQADEQERFSLHDLLADFAAHRLDLDESPETQHAARLRMLDFYVETATEAAGQPTAASPRFTDAAEALHWLRRERTNLTAAIRHAGETGCHDQVWRLTAPVATFLAGSGHPAESRTLSELAVASARATGDRAGEVAALLGLGTANLALDDQQSARRSFEAALRTAEEVDLAREQAAALQGLGELAAREDDAIEALGFLHRGLAVAERVDDRHGMSRFHCDIGRVLRTIDRQHEAIMHLGRAHWEAQRAGEKPAESTALTELGAAFHDLGDRANAVSHYVRALAVWEAVPNLASAASTCVRLCALNTERRHFEQAVRYGRRAVELLRGSQNLLSQAQAADALGDALYAAGELAEAAQIWREAADRFDHIGSPGAAIRVHAKIDNTHAAQERTVPFARDAGRVPNPSPRDSDIHLGLT